MALPLVSVICLCYNHEQFVVASLESVINQSYKNIELIIVDDKSSDNSAAIIKQWQQTHPDVKVLINPTNLGNTKAFNLAVKKARGSYLIDLAADDILLPNCITQQIACFNNSPENTAIVFGNAYLINPEGKRLSPYFKVDNQQKVIDKKLHQTNYLRLIGSGLVMCSVASMVKRSIFDKLNGYNEKLSFEDLDYWFRASRLYNIAFIDDFLVEKRVLTNSLGSQFHSSSKYNKALNISLEIIFKESLKRNQTKAEHQALLKRIHERLKEALKHKNIRNIWRYAKLKSLTHFYILTSK